MGPWLADRDAHRGGRRFDRPAVVRRAGGCAEDAGLVHVSTGRQALIGGLVDRNVAPPVANLETRARSMWAGISSCHRPARARSPKPDRHGDCRRSMRALRFGVCGDRDTSMGAGQDRFCERHNPYSTTSGVAGDFWTSEYAKLYDNLESELAAKYGSVPNIAEFVVSRCALFYPEPFILGTSIATNNQVSSMPDTRRRPTNNASSRRSTRRVRSGRQRESVSRSTPTRCSRRWVPATRRASTRRTRSR